MKTYTTRLLIVHDSSLAYALIAGGVTVKAYEICFERHPISSERGNDLLIPYCIGKFNKHIDLWDALEPQNQEFLSREGVAHVFNQLSASATTPDLETPKFTILKKKKKYEVRR